LKKWATRISNSGEVVISSEKHRDQPKNKEDALEKLLAMIIAILTPPKPRKKTKPTKGSKEKRLRGKKERSETKSRRKKIEY
jgi:ribosome-associated protein